MTTELNRRSAFRVPVGPASGLAATLHWDGTTEAVRPLEISLTGMSFVFPHAQAPELPSGTDVLITLTFDGEALTLPAVVVRGKQNGYGLFFPSSKRHDEVDPPRALVGIVMELQRRLLAPRS